ncbi:TetH/TetJ family tetracycline resistance MFS efflux pump, partial [Staphylococcus epidermidis]|nr:TetH/TetJ family tetracycline resistance MFS efflux pump [Staphylococcus epidermidis]
SYSVEYWDGLLWFIGAMLYSGLLVASYFKQKSPILKKFTS